MATQIKLRRDTNANWTANSTVVLGEGEVGVNLTSGQFKLGDGVSTWAELTYFAPGASDRLVNGVNEFVLAADGKLTLPGGAGLQSVGVTGASNRQSLASTRTDGSLFLTANSATAGDVFLLGQTSYIISGSNISDGATYKQWTFGQSGSLTFPDATVQTTAWTGSVTSLVNGAYAVALATTGQLNLPGAANGDSTNARIQSTNSIDVLSNLSKWTFSTDGSLTFPNATTQTTAYPGVPSLSALTGVAITSPSNGQVLKYNGTNWINDADATAGGAGVGTVTSVSVTSANGFTGTVATSSSTPAITIATSITGLLKGNATAISAATAGTDYQAPIGTISGIVKGNGANALTAATAGTDYQEPIGTISGIVKGNGANALTAATADTDYQSPVSATGILKSSGVSGNISAAVADTDYQSPVSATGILKSSGVSGNISAAVSGTDYQAPIGTITGLVKGNGANALTAATAGTDYQAPIGTISGIVKGNGANSLTAATAGTDYQAPLPTQSGQTGKYLTTDGTTLSWGTVSGGAGGTVTSVSVTSANGFAGTVADASSTPAITITTSITGILKGNATAISAATAGTDYQEPIGTISGIVKGNGANALTAATAGTDYQAPVSATGILKSSGVSGNVTAAVAGTDYQSAQSVTGIVKSSGTTRSAATAGTDYLAPPSGTALLKANSGGALANAVAGTDYQSAQSVTGIVKSSGTTRSAAVAGTDYQSAQSVSGIVKSSGTTRSAAVAGTDYQAPITLTTTGSSGAATFSSNTLNIPQYSGGASSFSSLSDATSASLTVDEIYLPAITMLAVTANGSTAYRFDQYGTTDDPTVYAISGTTIAFNLNVSGHPFLIRTSGGANYNDGLVHVSTTGTVTTGASAQGQVAGTLYWKIPAATTGDYQYICSIHGNMIGVITIKNISAI